MIIFTYIVRFNQEMEERIAEEDKNKDLGNNASVSIIENEMSKYDHSRL